MVFIANLVRLADFYGMLELVSTVVEAHLLSLKGLWADIAAEPLFYLILTADLKSNRLFGDALKHLIGRQDFDPKDFEKYTNFSLKRPWTYCTEHARAWPIALQYCIRQ